METTMTTATAMTAVREVPARPWRGADTAHAGTSCSDQGRTVPFAGFRADDLVVTNVLVVTDVRTTVAAIAPVTGVVYPRLEAPPV